MKKNQILILSLTAIYSYLFYEQSPGINYVFFNLALIGAMLSKQGWGRKPLTWLVAAAGCLVSAIAVALHGSALAVFMNLISFSLLAVMSAEPRSSFFPAIFHAVFSYVTSVFKEFEELIKREDERKEEHAHIGRKFLVTFIPLVVFFLFFFLYRAANPVFDAYAAKINLDFISFPWLALTFSGFWVSVVLLYPRVFRPLAKKDLSTSNSLVPPAAQEESGKKSLLNLESEQRMGVFLFVLINLLLLSVNVLDLNFLFLGSALPEGMTYPQFVHQGVGALIVSIVLAISIILYFFRGRLNFSANNKFLLGLAYLWVLQNAFMIISTAHRNGLYITDYGLTYKRVGVYFYLLLALTGLIFTFIKILYKKSNWFLFKANGWAFWAILLIGSLISWKAVIIRHNIIKAAIYNEYTGDRSDLIDYYYLRELRPESLPYILKKLSDLERAHPDAQRASIDVEYYDSNGVPVNFHILIESDIRFFLQKQEKSDWQSQTLDKVRTALKLQNMGYTINYGLNQK